MPGVLLTEDPTAAPASTVACVAEQLGEEPGVFAEYGSRRQTTYEHAWQIRDAFGYRGFAAVEDALREFLAA